MGLFNLFAPPSKIAPGSELFILEELQKTKYTPVNLHDYYVRIMMGDPSRYLVISSSVNGRIIPMIDCDNMADLNAARHHLQKSSIRHAVFESSPNHYWVFPDMTFRSFESAWKTICYVPGCDYKYLQFTKNRGFFLVRGELKTEVNPSLIHTNCVEPNVVVFLNNLIEYFGDDRLKVLYTLKTKRLEEWTDLECKKAKVAAQKAQEAIKKAQENWSSY